MRIPKLLKKFMFLFLLMMFILGCARIANRGSIGVERSIIGFQIQDDGHVTEAQNIPADIDKIYFETYVNISSTSEIALEYRWYYEGQLIYSHVGQHSRGYAIAVLEIDSTETPSLPDGNYSVQVWFLNTMLDEVLFTVQD